MAHYLDKDGLLRFFQGLKNVFAAKNHSHTTVNGHTVNADVPSGAKFTDTVYTHPSYTARTGKPTANATPGFGGSVTVSQITSDATGHVTGATDRTITIPSTAASQSAAGLMSAADKKKLDGIAAGAQVNAVTGVKGNSESSYRTGNVNLTAVNIGAAAASHTHSTQDLRRPTGLRGLDDNTLQTLVSTTRANRLAFLPGNQVIIEKTVDGGTTWTDAGYSDDIKNALFSEQRVTVALPTIDGKNNIKCGIRITFTAMRYNVPDGTAETAKYNYWNSNFVQSAERYTQLKEFYFWINTGANSMRVKAERATPQASTSWSTIFDDTSFYMTGWSGCDYIRFSQSTFGGGTNQVWQPWNYRLTFFTRGPDNSDTVHATTTSVQAIYEIRGYGDSVWVMPNRYMAEDKMYSFDRLQNVTFPARVTAAAFTGNGASITALNAGNISSGTLPVARGGTGQTTAENAANSLLNALTTGSSTPVDADYYISQWVGGGTTTTDYVRRPVSALWAYIKGKADSVYAAATHYHAAGDVTSGTFDAARIPSLAAGKITSGTFDAARIPSLDASKIGSGTLAAARLPAMTGATASAAGTQGAVPAPAAGKQAQFLRGDGTWATPTDTNTDTKVNVTLATTTKAFLLGTSTTPTTSAKGVTALADTGVYLDTTAGRLTATSFAGNGLLLTNLDAGNLYAGTVPRARLPLASSTQAGAMSAGDKAKLDSIIVTGANSVYLFKFSFAQNTFDSQQSLLYQVEDDDVGFDSTWLPEIIVPPQAGTYSSYASSLKGPIKVTTQADNVLWFQSSYPLLSSLTLWIKLTKTYQSNITEQELSA